MDPEQQLTRRSTRRAKPGGEIAQVITGQSPACNEQKNVHDVVLVRYATEPRVHLWAKIFQWQGVNMSSYPDEAAGYVLQYRAQSYSRISQCRTCVVDVTPLPMLECSWLIAGRTKYCTCCFVSNSYLCLSLQFHTCQMHTSSNLIRREWGSHQQSDMQCRDLGCSHSVRHTPITHLHSQVIHLGIARIFHDLCFEVVGERGTELRVELRTSLLNLGAQADTANRWT